MIKVLESSMTLKPEDSWSYNTTSWGKEEGYVFAFQVVIESTGWGVGKPGFYSISKLKLWSFNLWREQQS